MPQEETYQPVNSEEVQDIINAVPSWILRWGITLVFTILAGIVLLSSIIEYPNIIRTNLKVNSLNAPKPVIVRQNGKLAALLVQDGQTVTQGQHLGFLESTARPEDVLYLVALLNGFQKEILAKGKAIQQLPAALSLGEIQRSYQTFFQQYQQYQSTQRNGFYLRQLAFLEKDLSDISALKAQLIRQQAIQKKEYANHEQQYEAYRQLYNKKVISRSEFTQEENKFLASKYPLQQTETAMLQNTASYHGKQQELLDLRNTIAQGQANFLQSLNQCITECNAWVLQHVLKAPVAGKLSFAGIVQVNQNMAANQEIFVVNPGHGTFFWEIHIPQDNMGKIRIGQRTLVKLRSYPFEQYGLIRGRLSFISDVAYRDSVFIAKVSFEQIENKDRFRKIILKNGMQAEAEIIAEESTLLERFFRNVTKIFR